MPRPRPWRAKAKTSHQRIVPSKRALTRWQGELLLFNAAMRSAKGIGRTAVAHLGLTVRHAMSAGRVSWRATYAALE